MNTVNENIQKYLLPNIFAKNIKENMFKQNLLIIRYLI